MSNQLQTLQNLYDSHVHFAATGQVSCELDLSGLHSSDQVTELVLQPQNYRGPWLVGFGWDENKWQNKNIWALQELDQMFPQTPIYFSRCDGHSAILNTLGLKMLNLSQHRLFETDHYQAYEKLPPFTLKETELHLRQAMKIFNQAGFTHIRDMGGSYEQWQVAQKIEQSGEQTLCVEWNFVCEDLQSIDRIVTDLIKAQSQETRFNKVAGLKFYYDGSLGSETALLSQPYKNRTDSYSGMTCWPRDQVQEGIAKAWSHGLPVAIHTIGDAAVDQVVDIARCVSSTGLGGHLHLEHVEVIRPETLQKLKGLHVTCHLQPCHWHTDKNWLKEKLGSLATNAFPWEALRRTKIPFFFGSDSPIEKASLFSNLSALRESSRNRIPKLSADPLQFHVSRRSGFARGQTYVDFDNEKILEVRLDDKIIYQLSDRH